MITRLNDNIKKELKKLKIGSIKMPKLSEISGNVGIKGTPPGDMPPSDPEWWEICRDEDAPGIPHAGFGGCFECYTLCASDPTTEGGQGILDCLSGMLFQCLIPEVQEMFGGVEDTCSPWSDVSGDPDTWKSQTCDGAEACSGECVRFCADQEGFTSGSCRTSGDTYYCDCV